MNKRDIARFWPKVDVKGPEACWPWRAGRLSTGYGRFWLNGELVRAHRVAWAIVHDTPVTARDGGPPVVRHKCDNPPCCNPAHLLAGTQRDNMVDMVQRGRGCALKGEDHPRAQLTEKEVLKIRRLYKEGKSQPGLARRFGVHSSTIFLIVHRQTWNHLKEGTSE